MLYLESEIQHWKLIFLIGIGNYSPMLSLTPKLCDPPNGLE
jgi:hypothetical protein